MSIKKPINQISENIRRKCKQKREDSTKEGSILTASKFSSQTKDQAKTHL